MSKTDRYRILVAYYFGEARCDQTRAAELAGYTASSREYLTQIASQLFRRPEVKRLMSEHVKRIEISQEELMQEMADLARFDWQAEYAAVKSSEDMVRAKAFDTMMRGKIKAISDLLKIAQSGTREQVESVKAAISEWMTTNKSTAADAQKVFSPHIPEDIMNEVMRELLAADSDNKARLEEIIEEEKAELHFPEI